MKNIFTKEFGNCVKNLCFLVLFQKLKWKYSLLTSSQKHRRRIRKII